jgi:AmmeMemoRadiSam system protein B
VTRVRPAAVAGTFYPDDPRTLTAMIDGLMASVDPVASDAPPVALIAPHAGYIYSGPVAATAYARLVPWRDRIDRVVVVGPPHRVPVRGLALSSADAWQTPIGRVDIDREACDLLLARSGVYTDDRAHAAEHSIEVHVPFLQRVLGDGWRFVPVIAGGPEAEALADSLSPLWGAERTVVVVSTDLSHYHPQPTARMIDRVTAEAIVAGQWEALDSDQACGASGVRAALELSRRHGEHVHLLDLRNSGDTAGGADRVVGYASFLVAAGDG